jgi:hypothetical protein
MIAWTARRGAVALAWLKGLLVAAAIVAIALQWTNTRITILRQNQNPAHPTAPVTYPAFHSMATGLREGRIGQVDLEAFERYSTLHDPLAPFDRLPAGAAHRWANYYVLDVGYSFIVEAARLAFPSLPDNYLRALALQLVMDAATVAFVCYVFWQWHFLLGLIAGYLYASNGVFYDLVSFAYYYYWDIPLTFFVLGALMLAYRRKAEATSWLSAAGLVLGFGVWLRGSWWPLSLFLAGLAAFSPPLRRKLAAPIVAFAIVATPQVVRSSVARGQLTFTPRAVWHVAMVGLGYYPNPYGLRDQDEAVFNLTKQKYGVSFRYEDYYQHDLAAKKEFLSIWHNDRAFVIRSFVGRLKESVAGSAKSDVLSFIFFQNLTYRLCCLAGLLAMIARGGDKRLLAFASGGMYAIYVVLTCVFYYVGLAYDNVPEVALFVLFMGGLEAVLYLAQTAVIRLGPSSGPARFADADGQPACA